MAKKVDFNSKFDNVVKDSAAYKNTLQVIYDHKFVYDRSDALEKLGMEIRRLVLDKMSYVGQIVFMNGDVYVQYGYGSLRNHHAMCVKVGKVVETNTGEYHYIYSN